MKHLKMLGLGALSAMALMAFASSASATTLEINGTTENKAVTLTASLASGTSSLLEDTSGFSENTCKKSSVGGKTSVFTGTAVTGKVESLSFEECDRTVTVHSKGQVEVVWTSGTNGTVYSENAEVTSGSPFGHLNCRTTTTQLGTATGVTKHDTETGIKHATLHVNAQLTCSGISTRLTTTAIITTPTDLGLSS